MLPLCEKPPSAVRRSLREPELPFGRGNSRATPPLPTARRTADLATLVLLTLTCVTRAAIADPVRVVMVGDSITHGTMSGTVDAPSYPEWVTDWLGEDYEVFVEGCGLSDSMDWRPDSAYFYQPFGACAGGKVFWLYRTHLIDPGLIPADIVTILLGTNDATAAVQGGEPILPDDYEDNLRFIVEDLLLEGARRIILMAPPPLPLHFDQPLAGLPGATERDLIPIYESRVALICDDFERVTCGPKLNRILTLDDHFDPVRPDSVWLDQHPNPEGHLRIAVQLFDAISKVPEPDLDLLQLGSLVTLVALRRSRGRTPGRSFG